MRFAEAGHAAHARVRGRCTAGLALAAVLLQVGCAGGPFGAAPAPAAAPPPVVASPVEVVEEKTEPVMAAPEPAPATVAEASPAPAEPPLPPIDAPTRAAFEAAVQLLRANRLPEAERAFKALTERQQPVLAGVHANLGLIYRKSGRLEESAAALQEAIKLSPKQAPFHNQLGITLRELGRFEPASKAYEAAIELDPGHAGALVNLAILYDVYLGDTARAAELYTRGAALLPAEAATINKWLAELKGRKADPKLAATTAEPAAAAAPSTGASPAPAAAATQRPQPPATAAKPAAATRQPTPPPPRKEKP